MSFFSWFSRRPSPGAAPRKAQPSPSQAAAAAAQAQARAPKLAEQAEQLARKNVRMERREALYMVVRDAMARAGVLSAGYKFKVLSLDQNGQQFVVMIDLAREYGASTARLGEIESLITQSAKARFEILVTAVYWRMHDNTAAGLGLGLRMRRAADKESAPATASATPHTIRAPVMPVGSYEARTSAPAPLRGNSGMAPLRGNSGLSPLNSLRSPLLDSAHAPLAPVRSAPVAASRNGVNGANGLNELNGVNTINGSHGASAAGGLGNFDPIEDDEVAAFKRALSGTGASNGAARPASAAERPGTTVRSGPMSRSPLLQPSIASGFADTEMPADSASSDLSATQYGDLQ
ncbi:hypothetical protein [Diaphorobacter caeni]|uniref:hypothetical protein n=1 Tax=Diaphorobacter caeni TaxID=2784387 RepID=UPI00188FE4C5|nr:hypothetical protein [Diaphorobacter caeni]MBF5005039.1 hypothetical protein [Diaphorobacter caeni]